MNEWMPVIVFGGYIAAGLVTAGAHIGSDKNNELPDVTLVVLSAFWPFTLFLFIGFCLGYVFSPDKKQ